MARPVLKRLIAAAYSDPAVWDNMYMKSMLYRFLLCVPYTMMATMTPAGTLTAPAVVSHTGHLLDIIQLPNTEVRPICTRWVRWSYKRLMELAQLLKHHRPAAAALARALRHTQRNEE